jgi:hypothetical protein
MVLRGFGGSIGIKELPPQHCVRVVGGTQEEVPEADFMRRFGERHRSAYNLCKQVPEGLAFVISQDGDLRVFAGDGSTVHWYDMLHP